MEAIFTALAGLVVEQGLVAVVIGGLAFGWWKLAMLYHEVQQNRISEGVNTKVAIQDNTSALRDLVVQLQRYGKIKNDA